MLDDKKFKSELIYTSENDFDQKALSLFEHQWTYNKVYQQYCSNLNKTPDNVKHITEIPFLPIEFFKKFPIKTGKWKAQKIFMSSGTTGVVRSMHHIKDLNHYHSLAFENFCSRYGNPSKKAILAFLPSYLEQGDSSLISMINFFIKYSDSNSRFIKEENEFISALANSSNEKIIVGVSYALLDLAQSKKSNSDCTDCMVMETGGMKGRRKEIIREELHQTLKDAFRVSSIHSEYGMTELLSQAYGENGVFQFPTWAKCLIRDINDPFTYLGVGKSGGINVIDLANFDTCAFIETKDLGKMNAENFFEVLGRFDNTDIRGCNLMV